MRPKVLITNGFSDADGVELHASKTPATASTAPGDGRTVEESDVADSSTPPRRVQRKRAKGWRMPANTVYVGRPSRWGNPYAVGEVNGWTGLDIADLEEARSVYAAELQTMQSFAGTAFDAFFAEVREHLGGKNLACWCPLDQPCHADVLLELANRGDA